MSKQPSIRDNKLTEPKPEIEGTFEIRINNNDDKTYLFNYIYEYKHWQNIITILVTDLFKKENSDYKYFVTNHPHQAPQYRASIKLTSPLKNTFPRNNPN
jgi:hypothetical protein